MGPTQGPIRRATRFEFELTKSGSERDRVVNSETPVNQRLREFWREIPGCGRDLEGSSRTPVGLSRNGESRQATRSDTNRCVKGGNAKTPGGEPLGVFCELVCTAITQNRNELPERNPLRNNTLFLQTRKPLSSSKLASSSPFRWLQVIGAIYGTRTGSGHLGKSSRCPLHEH